MPRYDIYTFVDGCLECHELAKTKRKAMTIAKRLQQSCQRIAAGRCVTFMFSGSPDLQFETISSLCGPRAAEAARRRYEFDGEPT